MPSPNGQADPSAAAAAGALHEHSSLLASILAELRAEQTQIAVSDATRQGMVLDHHPVTGVKRVSAYRTGNGNAALVLGAATGALVLDVSEGRLGLYIVNAGANPVTLYLSAAANAGVPAITLNAGQSWNGLVGRIIWAGHVFALSTLGTTLSVAEV